MCERAAAMGGGRLIVGKTVRGGVTVAVAEEGWTARFPGQAGSGGIKKAAKSQEKFAKVKKKLKVKRNLQKSRKISTLHKRGGRILCVFTTK